MLKQLVRDIIQPQRDLGHSDRKDHKAVESQDIGVSSDAVTEKTVDEKNTSETDAATQFRKVAEQACEDCQ